MEETVEEHRQADEAAKGHRIKHAEPPGIGVFQYQGIIGDWPGRGLPRNVLDKKDKNEKRERHRNERETEDSMPADLLSQDGTEQSGQGSATIAGAGDAHCDALVLRRIPTA